MIIDLDIQHWNAIAEPILLLLMDVTIKSTLFLVVAGLLTLALRRASAAQRHLIWTVALIATLVLPLLFTIVPSHVIRPIARTVHIKTEQPLVNDMRISSSAPHASKLGIGAVSPATAKIGSVAPDTNVIAKHGSTAPPLTNHATEAAAKPYSLPIAQTLSFMLSSIWLLGMGVMLARMGMALRRLNALQRELEPLATATMERVAAEVLGDMKIHLSVCFRCASEESNISVPMTWGFLRPVVALPFDAAAWPAERLRAALLHESAHVKRADWLAQILASIACCVYWFNPLIWVAARGMRHECERAADDCALSGGLRASDYAKHLLDIAQASLNHRQTPQQVMAMARSSKVETRLRAVLARNQRRQQVTRKLQAAALITAVVFLFSASWFRFSARATALPSSTKMAANMSREDTPGIVIKASGSQAVLTNGFRVSLVGLTQAVQEGNQWNMFGGLWWSQDGTPITPKNGWQDGHWHWVVASDNLAPHTFKITVVAPENAPRPKQSTDRYDYNVYMQILGSYKPAQFLYTRTTGASSTCTQGTLIDDSTPHRFQGAVVGVQQPAIFPAGTASCVVRCGIATGPWNTIAALPFMLTRASVKSDPAQSPDYPNDVSLGLDARPRETYLDAHGKRHVVYFLGRSVLPNVARRIVAINANGESIPLSECPASLSPGIGLSFDRNSKTAKANPNADLSEIKELRLQTRPFQTVEFPDVQLKPTLPLGGAQEVAVQMLLRNSDIQVAAAYQLRTHLQSWARQNKTLLTQMAHAPADDFTTVIRVCDSLQRLPIPLWSDDPRLQRNGEEPILQTQMPSRLTFTHLQRSRDFMETQMRADFARRRDCVFAQSFNGGRVNVTLWASGRITRSIPRERNAATDKAMEYVQQEIFGPFLESANDGAPAIDNAPLRFRRYVSKPLKDGTRYTFLYPTYLRHLQEGNLDQDNQVITVRIDAVGQSDVAMRLRGGVPVIYPRTNTPKLFPHEEYCCVVVGKPGVYYAGRRQERQWTGQDGTHHDLSLTDPRTHMRFQLTHEDRYLPELFQQTDPIIVKSFRVLPPGASANSTT